jgi:hypothetical protein
MSGIDSSREKQNPTSLNEKWGIDIQPMLPSAKGLRVAERNYLNYATRAPEMQYRIFGQKMPE